MSVLEEKVTVLFLIQRWVWKFKLFYCRLFLGYSSHDGSLEELRLLRKKWKRNWSNRVSICMRLSKSYFSKVQCVSKCCSAAATLWTMSTNLIFQNKIPEIITQPFQPAEKRQTFLVMAKKVGKHRDLRSCSGFILLWFNITLIDKQIDQMPS